MSNDPLDKDRSAEEDELRPEYRFDYTKARPNRFAVACSPGGRLVALDPDVAQVFETDDAVNSALRRLIEAMPSSTQNTDA